MRRVKRAAGGPWSEFLESRTLLSGGPRIVFSSIRPGAEIFNISSGGWMFSVHFDQPVKPINLAGCRVAPAGNPQGSSQATGWQYDHDESEISLNFGRALPTGAYTITLEAGSGGIQGVDGAALDGEMTGNQLPSGDLQAGGDFVLPFTTRPFTNAGIEPKELIAWPVSDHEIELQWQADIIYNYGFEIERAVDGGEFELIGEMDANDNEPHHFVDRAAAPGQVYRYRVRSWGFEDDQPAKSGWSNETTSTVLPPNLYFSISTLSAEAGAGSRPDWLTDVNGTVFFTLSTGAHPTSWRNGAGVELWKTDGTSGGTERLAAISARDLTNFGGTLFFAGSDPEHGEELWKSDGTPEGTVRVADVVPGPASSTPRLLGVMGGRLYFGVPAAGQSYEIWGTDGTAGGTARASDRLMYLDEFPDAWREFRRLFAFSGGYLYFRRADDAGTDTQELWRTDGGTNTSPGAAAQVSRVIDPSWLVDFKGKLYFAADVDAAHPRSRGLFQVTETAAAGGGTAPAGEMLIATNAFGPDYGNLTYLTPVGDYLLFSGETQRTALQLYRSDGTAAGTQIFGRVNHTLSSVEQYDIVDAGGGTAYFFGNDYPPSLWKTDGTVAGTAPVRVYDFTYDFPTHSPAFLLPVAGGRAVYSDARDLWYSDGTQAGSYKIAAIGAEGSGSLGFAGKAALVVGDNVFFSSKRPDGGRELRVASLTPPAAPDGLTVSPVDPAAPSQPARPAALAAAVPPPGIRLSWNDRSGNESGFVIERSTRADFATVGKLFYPAANATEFVDTSAAPGVTYFYRARAVNAGGASSYSNTAAPPVPRVTAVYVSGGTWGDAFKARLQSDGIGSSAYGYSIFGVGDPTTPIPTASGPLPWANLDRVTVQIDPATPLTRQDLERLATAMAGNAVFTGFTYDAAANTATWTAAPGSLDGPVDITFDAGGVVAGPLHYRLNVLGGDATRDGAVNALDLGAVKRSLNATAAGTGPYSPFADVTGDGRINALDLGVVKQRLNRRLAPAAVPQFGAAAPMPARSDTPSEDLFSTNPVLA